MKSRILFASAAATALFAAHAQPAFAQEASDEETVEVTGEGELAGEADFSNLDEDEALAELEREIEAQFGILRELFKVEPLTEEQEALLPLAQQMTGHIFPAGTFGTVMKDAMDPMMSMVMSAVASDPRIRLAEVTGVETDDLESLDDTEAQEALDICDPGFPARTDKIGEVMVEMMRRLFDAIEPSYRDAMARALTTRFDESEMREALTLLENPIVAKLAQQAFVVQYDPQMLAAMEQMGPALLQVIPEMMEEFGDLEQQFADEGRNFTELSRAERERAARLLGKSENELDALTPEPQEAEVETEEDTVI